MLKFLRRALYCSRDIHCRMKYDDGSMNNICSAGTCEDCGKRSEEVKWDGPIPKVKPPMPKPPSVIKSKCPCAGCKREREQLGGYQPCTKHDPDLTIEAPGNE